MNEKHLIELRLGIYGLVVPGDAKEIKIEGNYLTFTKPLFGFFKGDGNMILIPSGEWSILGTVQWKDGEIKCDFDPTLILEFDEEFAGKKLYTCKTMNPEGEKIIATSDTSLAVFVLLQSKGLYWVQNEIKNPVEFADDLSWNESVDFWHSDKHKEYQKEYESAQRKCLTEKDIVIIIKKTK